jgi:hypothetical protein
MLIHILHYVYLLTHDPNLPSLDFDDDGDGDDGSYPCLQYYDRMNDSRATSDPKYAAAIALLSTFVCYIDPALESRDTSTIQYSAVYRRLWFLFSFMQFRERK